MPFLSLLAALIYLSSYNMMLTHGRLPSVLRSGGDFFFFFFAHPSFLALTSLPSDNAPPFPLHRCGSINFTLSCLWAAFSLERRSTEASFLPDNHRKKKPVPVNPFSPARRRRRFPCFYAMAERKVWSNVANDWVTPVEKERIKHLDVRQRPSTNILVHHSATDRRAADNASSGSNNPPARYVETRTVFQDHVRDLFHVDDDDWVSHLGNQNPADGVASNSYQQQQQQQQGSANRGGGRPGDVRLLEDPKELLARALHVGQPSTWSRLIFDGCCLCVVALAALAALLRLPGRGVLLNLVRVEKGVTVTECHKRGLGGGGC